jgi:hypothetical protein
MEGETTGKRMIVEIEIHGIYTYEEKCVAAEQTACG